MAGRIGVIISRQIKAAQSEFVRFTSTDNVLVWYLTIHGLTGTDGEFLYGEYIYKIVFPADYPRSKCEFYSITPTGIFKVGAKICFQETEVIACVSQLIAKMLDWRVVDEDPANVRTTADEKKRLADESSGYNRRENSNLRA